MLPGLLIFSFFGCISHIPFCRFFAKKHLWQLANRLSFCYNQVRN
ncbi:hypothetical protein B4168_2299 [Anoxybacillus flavithermus]|nr:hypothetical protein B4168_2299 [Anoxybacillus flavithermus]OAO85952.1 hypothetical protein GT23_2855 [Parageobacillus thermoglucosidasius]